MSDCDSLIKLIRRHTEETIGPIGPQGDTGPTGLSAYEVYVEQEGESALPVDQWLESLVGPQGEQGPQGDTGPTGDTGPQGEQGIRGDTGSPGFISTLSTCTLDDLPVYQGITDVFGDHTDNPLSIILESHRGGWLARVSSDGSSKRCQGYGAVDWQDDVPSEYVDILESGITPSDRVPLFDIGDGFNVAGGIYSGIGSGGLNYIGPAGDGSVIAGGTFNRIGSVRQLTSTGRLLLEYSDDPYRYQTIAGGYGNIAGSSLGSSVGGGINNVSYGICSTVGGGEYNEASRGRSTVAGGSSNRAAGTHSTIGGGSSNETTGTHTTIGGGSSNRCNGNNSTIGGGVDNWTFSAYSTIGGGYENSTSGQYSVIGGGYENSTSGQYSAIEGGRGNMNEGQYSTIGGGRDNKIEADYCFIGGGRDNQAKLDYTTIPGGRGLIAEDTYATVFGKYNRYRWGLDADGNQIPSSIFMIGWGDNSTRRRNLLGVKARETIINGQLTYVGDLVVSGRVIANSPYADYAEKFWSESEIPPGTPVTILDDGLIRAVEKNDSSRLVIGIVTTMAGIVLDDCGKASLIERDENMEPLEYMESVSCPKNCHTILVGLLGKIYLRDEYTDGSYSLPDSWAILRRAPKKCRGMTLTYVK